MQQAASQACHVLPSAGRTAAEGTLAVILQLSTSPLTGNLLGQPQGVGIGHSGPWRVLPCGLEEHTDCSPHTLEGKTGHAALMAISAPIWILFISASLGWFPSGSSHFIPAPLK